MFVGTGWVDRRWVTAGFAGGILLGVLMAALFVGRTVWTLQQAGVEVEVDTAAIASQVQAEVKAGVRREVPGVLASLRNDIPRQVAADAAQKIREKTFDVAGFKVPVPESAAQQIQASMEEALRTGMDSAIRSTDVGALAERLGERMGAQVAGGLKEHLNGMKFAVRPWPWLQIPVTVIAR